jgi:hypothetical protein
MGGNALKNVNTIRLSKAEFEPYVQEVCNLILTKFTYVSTLKYYRNKQSFGDLDLLLKKSESKNAMEIIKELFNPTEIYLNDNAYSFDYKNFQIDMIFKNDEDINSAEFFFAYNDLGNLIGRIANKFNLKFGFEGLQYVVRNHHGRLSKRIQVSKDERKILEFLGLSYERFVQGFDDVTDIYDYVISSKYFNADIFSYENLNHTNRTRNRKRVNYAGFLEYLESSDDFKNRKYQFDNEDAYLHVIEDFFPECQLMENIKNIEKEYENYLAVTRKFSGSKIMELTKLDGRNLGLFIEKFKQSKPDFFSYLEQTSEENIYKDVNDFFNKCK